MLVPANQADQKIGTISDTKMEWYLPAEKDDNIQLHLHLGYFSAPITL